MTTDWRSQYGLLEYLASKGIYPAPAIVQDGNDGTYSSIQAALDASETDIFVRAAFSVSSSIVLPDHDVRITFAPGATITLVGGIPCFKVPDGLTAYRQYVIQGVHMIGAGTAGSEFLRVDDAGGYASVDVDGAYVFKPETLVNFSKYDETYFKPHRVQFWRSRCIPNGNNSILVKAKNPAGTFAGANTLEFHDTRLANDEESGTVNLWFLDAEVDIAFVAAGGQYLSIKQGSKFNGLRMEGASLAIGNGDVESFGGGWAFPDFLRSGTLTGFGADARLIMHGVSRVEQLYTYRVCVKILGTRAAVVDCDIQAPIDMTYAALEINGATPVSIRNNMFSVFAGPWSQGCIKLVDASSNDIQGNKFTANVTGKTINETGTSGDNVVLGNVGVAKGTGLGVAGAGSVYASNIN